MARSETKGSIRKGRHVPTMHFFLMVLIAGLVIPAIIVFVVEAEPFSLAAAGRAIGATAFLVGAAAVIVLPWRAFQSRSGDYTDTPIVYGTFFFAVFTVIFIVGAIKSAGS